MPLNEAVARREIHHRVIDMRAYARDDGLFDIESHLVDRKPFPFLRFSASEPMAAGQALHDLWLRVTVDADFVVRGIEAASLVTPFGICQEAESTLAVLVGERIGRGWSSKVKEQLRGTASCTHLMEMLIPLATTAMQGVRAMDSARHGRSTDAGGVPLKIDSCYAYGRQREFVKRLWPEHHRPT